MERYTAQPDGIKRRCKRAAATGHFHRYAPRCLFSFATDLLGLQFDDFYRFMVETARLSGVEVRAASHVEAVAEDGTSVRLANGQTVSADIIVAAGGVGSIVRRELLDNEEEDKGAPLLNFKYVFAEHCCLVMGADGLPVSTSLGRKCARTQNWPRYGRM